MRRVYQVASAVAVALPLLIAAGQVSAGSPEEFAELISSNASDNGVPVELANAVIRYESNYNPRVTGLAGEIGLMQIKLETARGIGYRGSRRELYNPETNIAWGMRYLGQAVRMSGGSDCGTLSRYNAGLFTRRLVPSYCRQVLARRDGGYRSAGREIRVADADRPARGRHQEQQPANLFEFLFGS